MTMSQSRIWVSMMLLLGIAALGLGVPQPGHPPTRRKP
jgi:hypothetical protein